MAHSSIKSQANKPSPQPENNDYGAAYCLATPISGKGITVVNATLKLCYGFMRANGIEYPNDLAAIVLKFLDKDKIFVKFKNVESDKHDSWSTVLFKPDIETIMKELQMQTQLLLEQQISEGKTTDKKKEKHGQLTRLAVRMTENECNDEWYNNEGYFIQYGIISIPKSDDMIKENNEMNVDVIESRRNISYKSSKDNNDNNDSDKKEAEDYLLKLIGKNCGLDDIIRKTEFIIDETLSTKYLHCLHFCKNNNNRYTCSFGKDNFMKYVEIYKDDSKFALKKGDWIDICIKETRHRKKYLCFLKNNKLLIGEKVNQSEFKNGYIKLDFENNFYYFGLSSIQCNCPNTKGFEFKVSLKSK